MATTSVATITGDLGAGVAIAAKVFHNITGINFDFDKQILTLDQGGLKTAIDVTDQTTLTFTVSSGVYSLTVA